MNKQETIIENLWDNKSFNYTFEEIFNIVLGEVISVNYPDRELTEDEIDEASDYADKILSSIFK